MSDASRHDEIEDVLSSIRRLVADGPEAPAPRRNRLVLTPALRVPGEEADDPVAVSSPAEDIRPPESEELAARPAPAREEHASPPAAAGSARGRASSLAERIAELEAVVAGYDDDEEEGESGEHTPPPPPGTPAWRAAVFPGAADAGARQAADDGGAGADPAPQDAGGHGGDAGDAATAAVGPGRAATGGAARLPRGANADAPPADAGALPTNAGAPPADAGGSAQQDGAGRASESEDVGGGAAGSGAARADDGGSVADDRTGAHEAGAWADLPDEAVLREIVAEIVREELQGRLGERITRNVRKLVRQEINRALASREFE